jgi:GNAT superfamily N-acetyltransferase
MMIGIETTVACEEAVALYDAVGWTAYTRDPASLSRAIAASHLVVTARDGAELVGLARTISDGVSICYLQDLLVRPDRQRAGIGRALIERVLEHYSAVRQFVLMTDLDGPTEFYRGAGLVPLAEHGLVGFARP